MLHFNVPKNNEGFTLIEILVILIIAGILSAISVPSFLAMYNRGKVNDALTQVRATLQQAQTQAIRKNQSCTVTINSPGDQVTSSCFAQKSVTLDSNVDMASNIASTKFSYRGTVTLGSSGTIVFFVKNTNNSRNQKCLVISSPLGIIRNGVYSGSVTGTISAANCS